MDVTGWMRLLVAVPLLAWVPGVLIWRALGNGVPFDRSERRLIEFLTSIFITTLVATFLAELSIFSSVSLLGCLGLVCLIVGWNVWRVESSKIRDWRLAIRCDPRSLFSPWAVGLSAVLILAAFLFFHPAEAFLVMDDSGVYVIHGLTLARTGGLSLRDPLLPSLSLAEATELLPFIRHDAGYIRIDGAFHIWHWGRGIIQPSFLHLPSIWMAVLASLGGPSAAVWATPLAGLMSIAAAAFLARRLFGSAVGLATALLLATNFPQVWYARYPTSEMYTQAWLMSGLFLLTVFLQQRWRLAGVVAGLGLGELLLIRVDAWIAPVAVLLCFAGWFLKGFRASTLTSRSVGDRWCLVPLVLTMIWATLHAWLFATAYVTSIMHLHLSPRLAAMAMLGVAVLAGGAAILWYRSALVHTRLPFASVPVTSLWGTGLVIAGIWVTISVLGTQTRVSTTMLRWLSWYLTPIGLIAACAGLVRILRRGSTRPTQAVLLIVLLYALLYLPNPRTNHPIQPWGIRRLVPAVLPGLMLMMAYFAATLPLPVSQRWRQAIRVGLVVILALLLARPVRPVLAYDEYAGVWEQLDALAERFNPGAVVLFNRTGVGQAVAQPLMYLYDRPSFILQAEKPDLQVIEQAAMRWDAEGRPVYLALTGLAPWLADLSLGLEPVGEFTLRFPRLEPSQTHPPRKTYTAVWRIDLYRLVPEGKRGPVSRLDMGPGELPYLRQGFHDRETTPEGVTFRWTDGDGVITLPVANDVSQLRLRVAGPPADILRPTLRVFIDGEVVGAWKLPDGFVTLQTAIPPQAAADGRLEIELRSDTWVPRQAGRGDDERRLGVVVDWISVNSIQVNSKQ